VAFESLALASMAAVTGGTASTAALGGAIAGGAGAAGLGGAGLAVGAGAGIGAYSAYYQGQAQRRAAEYNADVANRTARIARDQAYADAADKERENRRYLGQLHATFGASGLALEGSALDIYEDQALTTELAVRRITYAGELRALGYQTEAELQRARAEAASTAGYLGAAAQIAGGAASYYRLQRGTGGGAGEA